MRAPALLLLVLAACGAEPEGGRRPPPPDRGFLSLLPEGTTLVARLPTLHAVEEQPDAYAALARAFGWPAGPRALFFGAAEPKGIDGERAPGLALAAGALVRYLPARDKGALNRALLPLPREVSHQERDAWIVLARGGRGIGEASEEPLPEGDLALRVRHHPLLMLWAQPGDVLDLGVEAGGGGLDFAGRLRPGADSATRACLAEARPGDGSLLDYIPSSLAVRIETTLAPTFLAGFLVPRVARILGLPERQDAVVLERLVREALTGADPAAGIALGLEFWRGAATAVLIARDAEGDPSPILAKVRRDERSGFGALILDRREAPDGLLGWSAWIAQSAPTLDGVPECLWPLVGGFAREEEGLPLAYATHAGWSVFAVGPRADLLARAVRAKLAYGANRSPGSFTLLTMRDKGEGDYVLGMVLAGEGFEDLPPEDRAALRGLLFAGEAARAPESLALAAFRREGEVRLFGRLRY